MLFILALTLFGLLIALRPLGLTAVLLLLAGRRGTVRAIGFAIGWIVTIAVTGIAVVAIFHGAQSGSSERAATTAASFGELVLGIAALAAAAAVHTRARRRTTPRPPAKWPERLDRVGIPMALVAGVIAVSHVTAAAASLEIYREHLSQHENLIALVWLAIVGTSAIVIPVVLVTIAPDRFRPELTRISHAIDAHSDQIVAVVLAILGVYLTLRGLSGIA
jgi:hypothetical protein